MKEEKFIMFRNRLEKVYRHLAKQAKRRAITCYRLYDHDLPEFPFCIEIYDQNVYVAEYKRRHGMNEDEHDSGWNPKCQHNLQKSQHEVLRETMWRWPSPL